MYGCSAAADRISPEGFSQLGQTLGSECEQPGAASPSGAVHCELASFSNSPLMPRQRALFSFTGIPLSFQSVFHARVLDAVGRGGVLMRRVASPLFSTAVEFDRPVCKFFISCFHTVLHSSPRLILLPISPKNPCHHSHCFFVWSPLLYSSICHLLFLPRTLISAPFLFPFKTIFISSIHMSSPFPITLLCRLLSLLSLCLPALPPCVAVFLTDHFSLFLIPLHAFFPCVASPTFPSSSF